MLQRIRRFIYPDDSRISRRRFELALWAFILSLAYYPGPFGFLAWFALVRPLMILSPLRGTDGFNAAFWFGFFFNLFTIYWVGMVSPPGMVAAVIILAFYYATMIAIYQRLYAFRGWLGIAAFPLLWIGVEYFRNLTQFAFPWSDLGYTQSYYLYVVQFASLFSVHGLSCAILVVNVLLWQLFRERVALPRKLTALLIACAIPALLVAYGWAVVPVLPKPGEFQVALLQGSVPLDIKWDAGSVSENFLLYDSLIGPDIDTSVQLYVWPETAAPCYLETDRHCQRWVEQLVTRTGGYHLIGALTTRYVGPNQRYFNAVMQFSPDGTISGKHEKVKLLPFAETVPYQDYLPFLSSEVLLRYLTFIETWGIQWWSDFRPGDSLTLLQREDVTYATLICFESAFVEFSREAVRKGAHFLVGVTNDTWFGKSLGVHMHARIFHMRAVENRSWGIRVANSGLSYIVDPYGRISDQIGLYEVRAGRGKVGLLDQYSFFTKNGDLVGQAAFLLLVTCAGIFLFSWVITSARSALRSRS